MIRGLLEAKKKNMGEAVSEIKEKNENIQTRRRVQTRASYFQNGA